MATTFTLLVAVALLALTAGRICAALGLSRPATFLVGAFVIAHAELLVVALGLSLFRGFTPLLLLLTLALLAVVTALATRGRRSGIDWRAALRVLRSDPALTVLAVVVALGLAYVAALAIGTTQVEDDVVTFHGVRAGLWRQHHGITYLVGIFDLRNNAYPPGGELGASTSMVLAGNDRFVALDQFLCVLALAVATAGIARRIGVGVREAAFGGLLVATLPLIVLQGGTAMSDLLVGAFLLSAALFLADASPASPWLAGLATALAIDVKLSAPLGVPLLAAIAIFARPARLRVVRLVAIGVGALAGCFWYAVNLVETHAWDGHVTEEFRVDHAPAAIVSRFIRIGIEFIDLSGATGRDRWLYAVAAGVVLAIALVLRSRIGIVAAALTAVPVLLLPLAHQLVRAEFKAWDTLGRRDIAALDAGHDITRAAANFSWYGPLGSLALVAGAVLAVRAVRRGRLDRLTVVLLLAPVYWLAAFSAFFFYQEWAGRFFVFPLALTAATWGLLLTLRWAAWATVAIAATTLFLVLANDARRPSGLPLLEGNKPRSIWHTPRWMGGPETRRDYDAPIRFLDKRLSGSTDVGLATVGADPVYPFFGSGLDRRVVFVYQDERDAPVKWVFLRPEWGNSLCPSRWKTVAVTSLGWKILHRSPGPVCT